jgi:hypothetical protein
MSTGERGFLAYGPYLPMDAGDYKLVVKGSASSVATAWVDVVSERGTIQHAKFPLCETPEGKSGVLASGRVILEEPVDDLEVRVYVEEQDIVCLDGYELVPIKGEQGCSTLEIAGGEDEDHYFRCRLCRPSMRGVFCRCRA